MKRYLTFEFKKDLLTYSILYYGDDFNIAKKYYFETTDDLNMDMYYFNEYGIDFYTSISTNTLVIIDFEKLDYDFVDKLYTYTSIIKKVLRVINIKNILE